MEDNKESNIIFKLEEKGGLTGRGAIFRIKSIAILHGVFGVLYLLFLLISKHILEIESFFGGINIKMPQDIKNVIIPISTISITMFQIILGKVDNSDTENNIVGMSYKKIFIKDTIWKYINFPNSMWILLETIVFAVIVDLFEISIFTKALKCVLLILSIVFSICVFVMSLIVLVKRSRVYYKIKKKITHKKDLGIIDSIISKLYILDKQEYKYGYNTYLYEEIAILIHTYLFIEDSNKENQYKDYEDFKQMVINIIKNMIISDHRGIDRIINTIENEWNEEFKGVWGEEFKGVWGEEFDSKNSIWNIIKIEVYKEVENKKLQCQEMQKEAM